MEDIEQGLTETEGTVVEDPTAKTEDLEQTADTDAGVTGEGEPAESGEPQFGPVPYERFSEVVDERNRLRDQSQTVSQLALNDPAFAEAYQSAVARQNGGVLETTREEPEAIKLPEDWELESDGERALAAIVRQQAAEMAELRTMAKGAFQSAETVRLEKVQAAFDSRVDTIAKEAGVTLTQADRDAIAEQAIIYGNGVAATGRKDISFEDTVTAGFVMFRNGRKPATDVDKAKAERDAELRRQKAAVAAGRPGSVGGASVEAVSEGMTTEEALDYAARKRAKG